MSKVFSAEELEEMRQDLARNPGIKGPGIVAQLHGCKPSEVIEALGLNKEEYTRRKHTPDDKKAAALARIEAGELQCDVAADFGVKPSTIRKWIKATAPQKEAAEQEHLSPERPSLSSVAQSHWETLDAVLDYLQHVELLSDDEAKVMEQVLVSFGAFIHGLEYAERSTQ